MRAFGSNRWTFAVALFLSLCGSIEAGAKEPAEPLAPVAQWLIAAGKPKDVSPEMAKLLGFAGPFAVKQKAYKSADGLMHVAQVSSQNGSDMIFGLLSSVQEGHIWRTDKSGKLIITVKNVSTGSVQIPNAEAAADFEKQKAYFVAKVPPTDGAAPGAGPN